MSKADNNENNENKIVVRLKYVESTIYDECPLDEEYNDEYFKKHCSQYKSILSSRLHTNFIDVKMTFKKYLELTDALKEFDMIVIDKNVLYDTAPIYKTGCFFYNHIIDNVPQQNDISSTSEFLSQYKDEVLEICDRQPALYKMEMVHKNKYRSVLGGW